MKVLITGFDPFGDELVNPAWEAVKQLPDHIGGAELIKLNIPTSFRRSAQILEEAIFVHRPDVILSIGQAGGRSQITVEKIAINLAEARIPDNDGEQPLDQAIRPGGETAYFATIPVKAVADHLRQNGIPSAVSYTAGTFVCNSIMYLVLHLAKTRYPGIRAGFIHVPFAAEQAVRKPAGTPFMSVSDITRAIRLAVETIITTDAEVGVDAGTIA